VPTRPLIALLISVVIGLIGAAFDSAPAAEASSSTVGDGLWQGLTLWLAGWRWALGGGVRIIDEQGGFGYTAAWYAGGLFFVEQVSELVGNAAGALALGYAERSEQQQAIIGSALYLLLLGIGALASLQAPPLMAAPPWYTGIGMVGTIIVSVVALPALAVLLRR